jgi:histidine triad (HIT) family protein
MSDNCIFCKIVRGEIPSRKVFEDEHIYAFHDINPQRPVHVLVVPKKHITSLAQATDEDTLALGRIMVEANRIATAHGSADGFRLIVNTGRVGCQDVMHVHAHIIGGPDPVGPMLKPSKE